MSTKLEVLLEGLCAESSNSVQTKLKTMHKVIGGFKRNNVELTAPNLVEALGALGVKMSVSSIYNKRVRGKDNPYRLLFDAWANDINTKTIERSERSARHKGTTMTDSDFSSINSDLVKFKVQNMYNELRSARHQINLLKDIQSLPVMQEKEGNLIFHKDEKTISFENAKDLAGSSVGDLSLHIDVLEDFIQGSSKVEFNEEGALVATKTIRKEDLLSDVELLQALVSALQLMKNQF